MPPNSKEETTELEERCSLSTSVGGVLFSKPLLNSSNPSATSLEQLTSFVMSKATGAFSTRTAYPGFVHDDTIHQWRSWGSSNSINCFGYSSESFEFYLDVIQKLAPHNKPAVLSLSGTAEDVRDMMKTIGSIQVTTLVEINLSCPNFHGAPPIAYDAAALKDYLTKVFENGSHSLLVGCKTPPYVYSEQFQAVASVLNEFPNIRFVTCINTVGCGLVVDIETEAPVLPAVYGGLGGPAVHATALANVRQMRKLLRADIDVIGVGGVDSGAAAFRMLLCGASAVGVGTAVLQHGVGILDTIEAELCEIMLKKGYTSIDEFRGQLKESEPK